MEAVKAITASGARECDERRRCAALKAATAAARTVGPSKVADGRDVAGGAADQFDQRCSCENGQRCRGRIKRIDSINASASKPRLAGLAAIRLRTKWRDFCRR